MPRSTPKQNGKPQGQTGSTPKKSTVCSACNCVLDNGKTRSIACDVCDTWFCIKCSKLKGSVFDEIAEDPSILWTCQHCNIALPGLKKVLATLTKFEERFERIETALENMQKSRDVHDSDMNNNQGETLQDAVRNVMEEEREIEKRRMNVIIHSLPESTADGSEARKEDDSAVVQEIVNTKLACDVEIRDTVRLGKDFAGRRKARPLRFSVQNFEAKRKVLDAVKRLKNDTKYSNVFLTPDLTKAQREQSFKLREEKRRRERAGETGLIIRRGKIVSIREARSIDHNYNNGQRVNGATGGGGRNNFPN